jgi:hypothetical protein
MVSTRNRFMQTAFACILACSGCAAPRYDVTYDRESGRPTITSIIQRIECELTDLVRDPVSNLRHPPAVPTGTIPPPRDTDYELPLLDGDYDVQVGLTLEANDTGGLTPSVTFMEPVTKLISFAFGGSATISESRDHTFASNFQLSMRQLYADAQLDRDAHPCPQQADTNLARTLELRQAVSMGMQTPRLPAESASQVGASSSKVTPTQSNAATTAFGDTIQFLLIRNISGIGPTWTTTRWKGPGGLLGLSHVNTDKVAISFAQGPNAGKGSVDTMSPSQIKASPHPPNVAAYNFLQQQLTQSINSQLTTLLNQIP